MRAHRLSLLTALTLGNACATAAPAVTSPPAPIALGEPTAEVIVIVRVESPWWAPRFVMRGRFVDALPEYVGLPGLLQKNFTIAEDGRFGGVYRWASRAAADAWFTPAWHARVRARRGVDAEVVVLEAPWSAAGDARADGEFVLTSTRAAAIRGPAVITWAETGALPPETQAARLAALAEAHGRPDGLLDVSFVRGVGPGAVGVVAAWRDEAAAVRAEGRRALWAQAAGGPLQVVRFEAPVRLDNQASAEGSR